jgi:hypothetical protein
VVIRSAEDLTRRTLLAGGGAAAAVTLESCSRKPMPSNVPLGKATAGSRADVALLSGLLAAERYAIAAYAAGMPLLGRDAARAAKQFLGQELAHAAELEGLIKQAGAKPAKAPAFYELGNPRGELDVLHLLHRAESAQLAAYGRAIPRLEPPRLRAAAAAILANDAQHLAVLRAVLGAPPVPGAFVSATE